MPSEVVLKRRAPLARLRYCIERLEKFAIARGEFPLLTHASAEAAEACDQLVEEIDKEVERLRQRVAELEGR